MKKYKIINEFVFYIIVSLTGIIVLPTLGILAPTFILCGIVMPFAGIVEVISYALGYNLPIFQIGTFTLNPLLGFIVSIIAGIIFYIIAIWTWKLLLNYVRIVDDKKKSLQI